MKVVMVSNFLSIHQLPVAKALHKLTNAQYMFIATDPVSEEYIRLGYPDLDHEYPFVLRAYDGQEEKKKAKELAMDADVVIHGSAPWFYLEERLKQKKLTFLYSERLYKSRYERWKWPVRMVRFYKKYGRHDSLYLLCASAYTAGDFAKTWTFLNKAYRWGYFPAVDLYADFDKMMENKIPASIMWAGRFIDWKHPDHVIEVAKRLKAEGYAFQIKMLGNGILWDAIGQMIREYGLEDCVQLVGAVPSHQVRGFMEEASIYLFTSDRNEGWGAVLNESMNSGCAVVASDAIGAVPFLLKDGENGLCYRSGKPDELYEKVKYLLENPEVCRKLGQNAYQTITSQWNAETAADRLMELSRTLLRGEKHPNLYENGPCSKAEILKD